MHAKTQEAGRKRSAMSYPTPTTQPGGFPPHQDGYAAASHRRSTNGLAITSFVLGIAGFLVITIPVNLILGLVALVRTRSKGDKGTGLAVAGLVLSILWAVGIGIAATQLAKSPEPKRDATGQINTTQKAGPDKLRVGDCIARSAGTEVTDVQAQPCSTPNSDKVFALFNLPAQAWPGNTVVQSQAQKGCTKRYQATHKRPGQVELTFFTPTKTRWAVGYHRVVCMAGTSS
jgi:hypothetical protein